VGHRQRRQYLRSRRATDTQTDDGEFIYVEYTGRGDGATGLIAASPTFQTGSEKYKWLNRVQAVSAGNVNLGTGELVYQLYEVKVTL